MCKVIRRGDGIKNIKKRDNIKKVFISRPNTSVRGKVSGCEENLRIKELSSCISLYTLTYNNLNPSFMGVSLF